MIWEIPCPNCKSRPNRGWPIGAKFCYWCGAELVGDEE